jgi:phosphatidylglycerophosphate synthase
LAVNPLRGWSLAQVLVWIPGLVLGGWLGKEPRSGPWVVAGLVLIGLISYAVLCFLVGAGRRPADWVTFGRLAGLSALTLVVAMHGSFTMPLFLAAVAMVLLDLVDGWVARRTGSSPAGAVIDMEADQLTTVFLALLATATAGIGAWILVVPGFKVLWEGTRLLLGLPAVDPRPRRGGDNRVARRICALVMTLLLICNSPGTPATIRTICAAAAVASLGYSFGRDALHLFRQRHSGVPHPG